VNNKSNDINNTAESNANLSLGQILLIEPNYKSKLRSLKDPSNPRKSDFINAVLSTINKFESLHADTTIKTLANIDSSEPIDTIISRVFVKNDTVYLRSSWSRDGELLWQHEILNPFLWISDEDEFAYKTRNIWVTFTIAVLQGIPIFYDRNEFEHISNATAFQIGKADLDSKQKNSKGLSEYINGFTGQLIEYGEPELREGLFFWHEPSKQFISFYKP